MNTDLQDKELELNEFYIIVIPTEHRNVENEALHLTEVRLKLIEDSAAFVDTLSGDTKVLPQEWLVALYDYYPADYACSFTGVDTSLDMEE